MAPSWQFAQSRWTRLRSGASETPKATGGPPDHLTVAAPEVLALSGSSKLMFARALFVGSKVGLPVAGILGWLGASAAPGWAVGASVTGNGMQLKRAACSGPRTADGLYEAPNL